MLYKKKYNRSTKKYYYKRRRNVWYNRTANKALHLAKYAVRNLNVEYKICQQSATSSTLGTTGIVSNLASIALGDSASDREGRQIEIKSLTLRGVIQMNTSATTTRIRVLICITKNNNNGTPAGTDVLNTTTVNSLRNLDNTKNIKVLYDKWFIVSQNTLEAKQFQINRKFRGIKQRYTLGNTGGAFSDTEWNALYLIAFSDEATNQPTISFNSRLRYIDN